MFQKKYKICLISDSLATGGAERVAANLSIFFESQKHDVQHVIVQDEIKYHYAGSVFNLGQFKNESNNYLNKIKRFIILKQFIDKNNFNFIIDFRVKNNFWQELLVSKIIYKPKTIYCIHSFMLDLYFPKNKWLAKIIFKNKSIVAISEAIKTEIEMRYNFKNVQVIYNAIELLTIQNQAKKIFNKEFEYIVAAGTMTDNKQFDKIITSYSKSKLPDRNINLMLLGDGKNKLKLEKLTKNLNLEHQIVFIGRTENPYKYFAKAMFLVQASVNEGLPMVLIESLACQTPVIAFDCKSGPSEIIINHQNGLLVENQNFSKLIEAMNLMINNATSYQSYKKNTIPSITKFSSEIIGNQWLEFLKKIYTNANFIN